MPPWCWPDDKVCTRHGLTWWAGWPSGYCWPPAASSRHWPAWWSGCSSPVRRLLPGPGPAGRLEDAIAPISAYLVLPVFALANAGVRIDSAILHPPGATSVFVGIVIARVVGKLGGITLACLAVVGLGWGRLPDGVRWIHVAGGAAIAGIGFTVPLLIAEQAFSRHPKLVDATTVGLLAGSVAAFVVGAVILTSARKLTSTADPARGTAWRGRRRTRGDTP